MKPMTKKRKTTPTEPKFPKNTLVESKKFCHNRDIVSALLEDGAEYGISEVETMIAEYMKGKVK
jgi:hypothetical protein